MEAEQKSLVIILGPTAVGKSATALKIAKLMRGEIINCDSMQVYRDFDVGTDKLSIEERENIPHHLLDIVPASHQFTAADFVAKSLEAIHSILKKKMLPIIVGGTGLYLKALLNGLFPEEKKDPHIRRRLQVESEEKGLEYLRQKLKKADPITWEKIGKNDRMRIFRALEIFLSTQKPLSQHFLETKPFLPDFNILRIGLKLERNVLYRRIEDRVDRMFEKGIVQEVQSLIKKGIKEDSPPFRALGYKYVLKYLKKEMTLDEAVRSTKTDTRHYAKRQMTWFRKMESIQWFSPDDFTSITEYIRDNLR